MGLLWQKESRVSRATAESACCEHVRDDLGRSPKALAAELGGHATSALPLMGLQPERRVPLQRVTGQRLLAGLSVCGER